MGKIPISLAALFLSGFLLVLPDFFGVSHALRQTRIFLAHLLQAVSPLARVASDFLHSPAFPPKNVQSRVELVF
jgi:hypothetical protein